MLNRPKFSIKEGTFSLKNSIKKIYPNCALRSTLGKQKKKKRLVPLISYASSSSLLRYMKRAKEIDTDTSERAFKGSQPGKGITNSGC